MSIENVKTIDPSAEAKLADADEDTGSAKNLKAPASVDGSQKSQGSADGSVKKSSATIQNLKSSDPFAEADKSNKKSQASTIENLKTIDPFAEADEDDTGPAKKTQEYIHIRIQQRNGRKVLTTVQGIPPKFDQKKIMKVIKKEFACNGTIISDEDSKGLGEVIQLQGDQREKIKEFLTDEVNGLGLKKDTIKIHGF